VDVVDVWEDSFWRAVVVCQPVTKSREIVRMRPRPGVECRDTVERRCRDVVEEVVEGLRDVSGQMDVDVAVDIVIDVWPEDRDGSIVKIE